MTDTEIRAEVDAFVSLSRKERREKFASLPREVRVRARKVIESRRGIAYRNEGIPVLTKDGYIAQILRQTQKLNELPVRMETLKSNVVELKRALQENYGDEALTEAENALEGVSEAANA